MWLQMDWVALCFGMRKYKSSFIVISTNCLLENGNISSVPHRSIDNDDFRGVCHGRPYPIIEAAKEAMLAKIG